MAINSVDLKRLAQVGAAARLAELERERQAILKTFPGLRKAAEPAKRRARRRMSAAARRRISLAAKKRWAEKKKQAGR